MKQWLKIKVHLQEKFEKDGLKQLVIIPIF